jgi:hypothetical protein
MTLNMPMNANGYAAVYLSRSAAKDKLDHG